MVKISKNKIEKIKDYWDDQARIFKNSNLATAPDTYYRNLEINQISEHLKDNKSILDIGCGNGYSVVEFAKKFSRARILGIDYSEKMINFANQNLKKLNFGIRGNIEFKVGDVLTLSSIVDQRFDYIVSERCIINLLNWTEQKKAIIEMKRVLKNNGQIILCENTQEGLVMLNELRHRLKLPSIKVRWHNYYLPQKKLLKFAKKHFYIEEVKNIGSLYYIISRVVYAKLCDLEKKEPDYLHPINKIASELPLLGDYSPNYIFVLRNKK